VSCDELTRGMISGDARGSFYDGRCKVNIEGFGSCPDYILCLHRLRHAFEHVSATIEQKTGRDLPCHIDTDIPGRIVSSPSRSRPQSIDAGAVAR
jgi:hypothetical protein